MFVSRGILTFDELLRKSVYNFAKRIERSAKNKNKNKNSFISIIK